MDGMYLYLLGRGYSTAIVSGIKDILEKEDYDTESIELDILYENKPENTNIAELTSNNNYYQFIKQYARTCKCMFYFVCFTHLLHNIYLYSVSIFVPYWISIYILDSSSK